MSDRDEIMRRLMLARDRAILARLDPDNPTCPGCGRRDEARHLRHEIPEVRGLVCPECADESAEPAGQSVNKPVRNDAEPPHPGTWLDFRWEGQWVDP